MLITEYTIQNSHAFQRPVYTHFNPDTPSHTLSISPLIFHQFLPHKFPTLSPSFSSLPFLLIKPRFISRPFDSFVPMKFGKRLKQQIQATLPSWRDKYLSYKELKQLVRLLAAAAVTGKAEAEFVYFLNNEIDKFNAFFMEQEEDFIIRHKVCLSSIAF